MTTVVVKRMRSSYASHSENVDQGKRMLVSLGLDYNTGESAILNRRRIKGHWAKDLEFSHRPLKA